MTESVFPDPDLEAVGRGYQDEEGRKKDDKSKTKVIKNQTRTQSSSLIGPSEIPGSKLLERICPAAPDRSGKEAVTRSKQKATYHETRRLSRNDSEDEWAREEMAYYSIQIICVLPISELSTGGSLPVLLTILNQ